MIYHSPESFYLSTYFLSFTYIPFYLAPYIYILHLSFFIFSSTSFQALSWVIFYLSLESFFIFLLSSFLSFFLIFFIFHLIFFHLSPETRKSKSPSAAAVHCCRHSTKIKMLMIIIDQWWWSRYHFTLTLFKMIVVRGSWRLTWSGSPPHLLLLVSKWVGGDPD